MDGILIIDKPAGCTSHAVCQQVKRLLGCRRVGHTGTLDPFATGVLPLLLDGATAWASRFADDEKEYVAVARLGRSTTTYDCEGAVTAERSVPPEAAARLTEIVPRWCGPIWQTPPPYSAVKYRGRPLYWWARRGTPVTLPPRPVVVHRLEVEGTGDEVTFHCTVSKGTYIRALIHAIGEELGCGAHCVRLRRLRCGPFRIDEAEPWPPSAPDKILYKIRNAVIA